MVNSNSNMKRTFILIFVSFLFSCKNEQAGNILPSDSEINEIIKTAILGDSLELAKENNQIPICNELKRITLVTKRNSKPELSPFKKFDSLLIGDLIFHKRLPYKGFFKASDSTFIKFQNKNIKSHILPNSIFGNLKFVTLEKGKNLDDKFFYFTIPILSADGKRAYSQLTWECYGFCGVGYEVFLEKNYGKWKVVKQEYVWSR